MNVQLNTTSPNIGFNAKIASKSLCILNRTGKHARFNRSKESYKGFINFAKQIKNSFCGFLNKIFGKNKPQEYKLMSPPEVELEVLGYDDYESSDWRDIIRKHLENSAHLSYLDYYELPKSDYQMESMIKSWGLKVDHITKEIIIPKYLNTKPQGNNNFRGALPYSNKAYEDLKKSGITTIIAAAYYGDTKEFAENNGLEYIEFFANNLMECNGSIFHDIAFYNEDEYMKYYNNYDDYNEDCNLSGKELIEKKRADFEIKNREFIENLIKSVSAWQNGCCFIGCTMGTNETSNAISLIEAFTPKCDDTLSSCLKGNEIYSIGILYKKLTSQDKKLMGWTKEFEQSFRKRFVRI